MSDLRLCGFVISETNDIEEIYFSKLSNGTKELFYNNEPYGIVSMLGFKSLAISEFRKFDVNQTAEDFKQLLSEKYRYMYTMLQTGSRGIIKAIVLLEDGLLLVKDIDSFEAVIQPIRAGVAGEFPYKEDVDTTNAEEGSTEYAEMLKILNLE